MGRIKPCEPSITPSLDWRDNEFSCVHRKLHLVFHFACGQKCCRNQDRSRVTKFAQCCFHFVSATLLQCMHFNALRPTRQAGNWRGAQCERVRYASANEWGRQRYLEIPGFSIKPALECLNRGSRAGPARDDRYFCGSVKRRVDAWEDSFCVSGFLFDRNARQAPPFRAGKNSPVGWVERSEAQRHDQLLGKQILPNLRCLIWKA